MKATWGELAAGILLALMFLFIMSGLCIAGGAS